MSENFETSLAELEQIVNELEAGDLSLQRSLELFERGVQLSRHCQKQLDDAERKVQILVKDEDGEMKAVPFAVEKE
jgi:exodeoxyribonuclease VII small subunit